MKRIRTLEVRNGTRHHLVKDVVRTLQSLLGDDTSLLEQIYYNQNHLLTPTLYPQSKLLTYKSRYQHQPIYQMDQSEYGWIYPRWEELFVFSFSFINRVCDRLTKREELSLRTVLALPKASSTGLVCTTWSSREPFFSWVAASFLVEAPTVAKYAITFFVFSVFPAPDSPLLDKFVVRFLWGDFVGRRRKWYLRNQHRLILVVWKDKWYN